eukprot:s172_g37.t1
MVSEQSFANQVSHWDAVQYCSHYGKRLPREWEWQYVAQGGDPDRSYPWGKWWWPEAMPRPQANASVFHLSDVGGFPQGASKDGVQDLVGLVWQWTSDTFRDEHTRSSILRGGSVFQPNSHNGDVASPRYQPWYFPGHAAAGAWNAKWTGEHFFGPKDYPSLYRLTVHAKYLLMAPSLDRAGTIGFRCVADRSALPVPSGAPVLPPGRGIRLAQEWINSYQVPLLSQTRLAYTPGAPPLDITNFSGHFTHTADVNANNIQRIKSSLENMSLLKGALEIFQHCDRERKGYLTWEHGEVYVFISKVFEQQGLVPPAQEQIRSLFQAFDSNRNGRLEPREGLCLVDALARAIILAQSPAQGYPKQSPQSSSYSLAEEWLSSFQPPSLGVEVNYGSEPVNLHLLAAHIKPVLLQNARHRQRMIVAIESGELLKEAMRLFRQCDSDRNGKLTWNEGEIRRFISQVLQHYNLVVPSEEMAGECLWGQLYEIYRHFDRDRSYSLDVRESLCLADAVVRAMYVDTVSPVHSAGSPPRVNEMGSPPMRRAAMTDEELARRVAHQDAAMEKRIERLIRACSDAVAQRVSAGVMHVMFSAWRQCATKDLFARAKEGWDRQCEELSAAAEKARRRLEEEQRGFEDEIERLEQRRVLDTTASLSAREAAEVAAEAEPVSDFGPASDG